MKIKNKNENILLTQVWHCRAKNRRILLTRKGWRKFLNLSHFSLFRGNDAFWLSDELIFLKEELECVAPYRWPRGVGVHRPTANPNHGLDIGKYIHTCNRCKSKGNLIFHKVNTVDKVLDKSTSRLIQHHRAVKTLIYVLLSWGVDLKNA